MKGITAVIMLVMLALAMLSICHAAPGAASKVVMDSSMAAYTTSKRPIYTTYTAARAVCWKANGQLGTCGEVTAATGACVCN